MNTTDMHLRKCVVEHRHTNEKRVVSQIAEKKKILQNKQKALVRVKSISHPDKFVVNSIEKQIASLSDEIVNCGYFLENIKKGDMDMDYEDEILVNQAKQFSEKEERRGLGLKRKENEKVVRRADKKVNQLQFSIKNKEKEMARVYDKFTSFELRDDLKKKLEKMPNNTGYIVCGNQFFGGLETEKGKPYVLFEKFGREGKMLIHTWGEGIEYNIKEKVFNNNSNPKRTNNNWRKPRNQRTQKV
jgi:hypothetical protein